MTEQYLSIHKQSFFKQNQDFTSIETFIYTFKLCLISYRDRKPFYHYGKR